MENFTLYQLVWPQSKSGMIDCIENQVLLSVDMLTLQRSELNVERAFEKAVAQSPVPLAILDDALIDSAHQ